VRAHQGGRETERVRDRKKVKVSQCERAQTTGSKRERTRESERKGERVYTQASKIECN